MTFPLVREIKNTDIQEIVDGKIAEIKKLIETTDNSTETKYLRERIAKLFGGVSIVKVGSIIESELQEKIDRVEDAVCAVRSAKEEGVLAGGGVALIDAFMKLKLDKVTCNSINKPFNKILENASVKDYISIDNYPNGYDVKNFKVVDMFEAGIVDSTKAIKHALINAVSASNTLLMTNAVLTNKRMI